MLAFRLADGRLGVAMCAHSGGLQDLGQAREVADAVHQLGGLNDFRPNIGAVGVGDNLLDGNVNYYAEQNYRCEAVCNSLSVCRARRRGDRASTRLIEKVRAQYHQ
jgi:hypothetical protein